MPKNANVIHKKSEQVGRMEREIFDNIWSFIEGKLFLLNFRDSLALNLINTEITTNFISSLSDVFKTKPNYNGWWLNAFPRNAVLSISVATLSGLENLATVVCEKIHSDPEEEFFGVPAPIGILPPDSEKLFKSRQTKKKYWISDSNSMPDKASADDARNHLGLDWVQEDMVLYMIEINTLTRYHNLLRPSALCDGSTRFRVYREDESNHNNYPKWGMTVDLGRWHSAKINGGSISGAPEVVSNIGPLNSKNVSSVIKLGVTRKPSGCTDDLDHQTFAKWLNNHKPPVADELYDEIQALL